MMPILPHSAITIALIILLAGCAVGPDHRRPQLSETKSYSSSALPDTTAATPNASAQRLVAGRNI